MEASRMLPLNQALQIVSEECNIAVCFIKGTSRTRAISDARKIYCYVVRNNSFLNYGFKEIGYPINRDHSTVLVAIKHAEDIRNTDKCFRVLLERVSVRVEVEMKTKVSQFDCIPQL